MEWLYLIVDFVLHIDVHLQELFTTYGIWVYGIRRQHDAQYGAMAQHSVYPYRSTFYVSLFQAG
jgi:hypothetical protein